MANTLVIPTDPIARKNLWREWIRHDAAQIDRPVGSAVSAMKRRDLSRQVDQWVHQRADQRADQRAVRRADQRIGDQRFDIALLIADIKNQRSESNQYRIESKPKPAWQWVASILLIEAAMIMIAWKIFIGA
ncbi:MAG TPA: hypothetical protein PK402_01795 [Tepidisphaeraceae bacterium]|nr:hypothetical protein [Tepidisphaeraceae bacterium]